jgi:hypothetical protein
MIRLMKRNATAVQHRYLHSTKRSPLEQFCHKEINDDISQQCTTPILITNAFNDWPAFTKWRDFNYFKSIDETSHLRVVYTKYGLASDDPSKHEQHMTFKTYIEQYIESESNEEEMGEFKQCIPRHYLMEYDVLDKCPSLQKDIILPKFIPTKSTVNLWMGPKRTIANLHYDSEHNLFCQMSGKKLIRLYDPNCGSRCFYVNHAQRNASIIPCEILEGTNDEQLLKSYPLMNEVTRYYEHVIEPGQMIYIPKNWFHYVRALTPSVSLNFWWK